METITTFLHLSDTHLCFAEQPSPICATPDQLEDAYAYAASLDQAPRFVVITGDFVHEGDTKDYEKARRLIDRLDQTYGVTTYLVLGNHDRHRAFWHGYLGKENCQDRYFYEAKLGDIRLLVLDSATDDSVPGSLDAEQLQWLQKVLAQPCEQPTILALHHPPCGTSVYKTNFNNLCNPEPFLSLLEQYPVQAVLCGHKHFSTATLQGSTQVYTGGGFAFGIEMPHNGCLRFVKTSQIHYCIFYDKRFYWSPVNLEKKSAIAEMTPQQMKDYHTENPT